MSRLVVQAVEFRALVESERDVFLAENVAWLQREGFPGSRMLVFAHSSHTNREARGKGMGRLLAEAYGDEYATATLVALSGQYRDFGAPSDLTPSSTPELTSFSAGEARPLARRLAALAPGSLLYHLRAQAFAEPALPEVDPASLPVGEIADVAILVRTVGPSRFP